MFASHLIERNDSLGVRRRSRRGRLPFVVECPHVLPRRQSFAPSPGTDAAALDRILVLLILLAGVGLPIYAFQSEVACVRPDLDDRGVHPVSRQPRWPASRRGGHRSSPGAPSRGRRPRSLSRRWVTVFPQVLAGDLRPPGAIGTSEVRRWFVENGAFDADTSYLRLAGFGATDGETESRPGSLKPPCLADDPDGPTAAQHWLGRRMERPSSSV